MAQISAFAHGQADDPVTIEGDIIKEYKVVNIQLSDKKIYELKSAKRQTQLDISHLENGDHIIGLGGISQKEILLEDLEMVGVRRVLGSWSEYIQRKLFEFRDFYTLRVRELTGEPSQNLNYRLVPDRKNEWTIFLSNNSTVKVGTLKYSADFMKIELVDLESGQITEQFNLSPLNKNP